MNVDDRRFLRRHLPSYVKLTTEAEQGIEAAVGGHVVAVRTDGVVFFHPWHIAALWVGWLERTGEGVLRLKETPAKRQLATNNDYDAELSARLDEARALLGQKVRIR